MNYRVVRIEEDVEFGCEERKEGDPVMAVVRLEDEDGDVKIVRQRDQMLYVSPKKNYYASSRRAAHCQVLLRTGSHPG